MAWLAVFSINLVRLLRLAWPATEQNGRTGMCIAIALCWLWVYLVGGRSQFVAVAFLCGGAVVALAQLLPFVHTAAVFTGIYAAAIFGDPLDFRRIHSELGGFVSTVIAGLILEVVALLSGIMILLVEMAFDNNPGASLPSSDLSTPAKRSHDRAPEA